MDEILKKSKIITWIFTRNHNILGTLEAYIDIVIVTGKQRH